jgi:HSP20 family protein
MSDKFRRVLTNSQINIRRQLMATPQSNQPTTSAQGRQQEQQNSLARRGGIATLPAMWLNPFDIFNGDPVSLFRRVQNEMTRAFAPVGRNRVPSSTDGAGPLVWVPAIDVSEQNGKLVVSAELPGLTDEDVTVEVSDDSIVIQGERQQEQEETQGGIHRTERIYGQFYRVIPLPDGANPDEGRAEFVNGVLRVSVPVAQGSSNVRQIPIQTSNSAQPSARKAPDQPAAKNDSSTSSESQATQKVA